MASNLIAMASNPIAMASNLVAMACVHNVPLKELGLHFPDRRSLELDVDRELPHLRRGEMGFGWRLGTSKAPVTTSVAPVTTSDALVSNSFLLLKHLTSHLQLIDVAVQAIWSLLCDPRSSFVVFFHRHREFFSLF